MFGFVRRLRRAASIPVTTIRRLSGDFSSSFSSSSSSSGDSSVNPSRRSSLSSGELQLPGNGTVAANRRKQRLEAVHRQKQLKLVLVTIVAAALLSLLGGAFKTQILHVLRLESFGNAKATWRNRPAELDVLVVPRSTSGLGLAAAQRGPSLSKRVTDALYGAAPPIKDALSRPLTFNEYLDYHFPNHDGLERDVASAPSGGVWRPFVGERAMQYFGLRKGTGRDDGTPLASRLYVWITLADADWVEQGTAALVAFVNQLNAEYAQLEPERRRHTALVTLCLDDGCLAKCDRLGFHCYGGYEHTRPKQMLRATWPKVRGLADVLRQRDVFFVDSDVFFRADPYPHMEPLMAGHDVLASENDAFGHVNTGWLWMRRSDITANTWQQVIDRDMVQTSRDQVNFNDILGTTAMRNWEHNPRKRPLTRNFVASNGLRVHVVAPEIFRAYHFAYFLPQHESEQSVFVHSTCADDNFLKVTIAKSMGYWPDLNGYYSRAARVLTVSHMTGTVEELAQQLRVLLSVAHYTGRVFMPPEFMTVSRVASNVVPGGVTVSRSFYSAFPVDHIAHATGDEVVESDYVRHAIHAAFQPSVLSLGRSRLDVDSSMAPAHTLMLELSSAVPVDVRQATSLRALVNVVKACAPTRQVVELTGFNLPLQWPVPSEDWRAWHTPANLLGIKPCAQLELEPECGQICRGVNVQGVSSQWPALASMPIDDASTTASPNIPPPVPDPQALPPPTEARHKS